MNFQYKIRPAISEDEPFLRKMLLETLRAEEDGESFTIDSLKEPMLARYVHDWGREGDLGFVAETEGNEKIGAVWSRLSNEDDCGYGFVKENIPELAIAISKNYRGKGIGSALMKIHIEASSKLYPGLSLSVAPNNPAKGLYESLGFVTIDVREGHPIMVLRFT